MEMDLVGPRIGVNLIKMSLNKDGKELIKMISKNKLILFCLEFP